MERDYRKPPINRQRCGMGKRASKIAERDFLPFPVQSAHITVERSNDELWPDMAWPNLKLALYTSDNTDEYDNWPNCDWKAYKIGDDTLTPEKFAEIIRNTTIR